MNLLILKPGRETLRYSYLIEKYNQPMYSEKLNDSHHIQDQEEAISEILLHIREHWKEVTDLHEPDAIGIRVLFGGDQFKDPVLLTSEAEDKIEKLLPHAPLHLPLVLTLIHHCKKTFPGIPVVLVFETAFFASLPSRENLYALNADVLKNVNLRRYGYHGLFHEAACQLVARKQWERNHSHPARIISLCLEPQPEIAAVIGNRPVMVTSGITPLEGLPGQTISGELDPSILLTLVQKLGWGPEQINTLLTKESGLYGLVGRPTTLESVFRLGDPELQLAKEILQYRILLACGAAIASLGGLDTLVFSGRFASLGETLAPWLISKLKNRSKQSSGHEIAWEVLPDFLDRIIADITSTVIMRESMKMTA